jgi:hypothetical protein
VASQVLVWRTTAAVPIEASYLFAESRLTLDERVAVSKDLKKCGANGLR